MNETYKLLEAKLSRVLSEIRIQHDAGRVFFGTDKEFTDALKQLDEYIFQANEFGLGYENIVCILEGGEFSISGKSAVCLLEVALLLGYKTERPEDQNFNRNS